jgi:hypothetical protein
MKARRRKLPASEVRRCCKNPDLPAALQPGFCDLKFCEDPALLMNRRRRRRKVGVEGIRI